MRFIIQQKVRPKQVSQFSETELLLSVSANKMRHIKNRSPGFVFVIDDVENKVAVEFQNGDADWWPVDWLESIKPEYNNGTLGEGGNV